MKFWICTAAAALFTALLIAAAPAAAFRFNSFYASPTRPSLTAYHSSGQVHGVDERHALTAAVRLLREQSDCRDHITWTSIYSPQNEGTLISRISFALPPSATVTVAECTQHVADFLNAAVHAAARHTAIGRVSRAVNEVADACAVHMGYLSYRQLQARAEIESGLADGKANKPVIEFYEFCRGEIAQLSQESGLTPNVVQVLDFCPHGKVCLDLSETVSDRIKSFADRHHEGRNVRDNLNFPEPEPLPEPEMTSPTASISTATVSTSTGT